MPKASSKQALVDLVGPDKEVTTLTRLSLTSCILSLSLNTYVYIHTQSGITEKQAETIVG